MKLQLHLFACVMALVTALGAWAQAPQSGTYLIKSPGGTYVSIKGKYYAKPDAASKADASQVGIGIGYKDGDGYHVYSLTGTNPKDGSTIEVYDYVAKACNIVSQFAQTKIDNYLGSNGKGAKQQALDDMADSICKIYTDDYAYMTLVPQGNFGGKWYVRAKATVPAIPYTVQAAGNYLVVGNEVIAGHKCTDVWDWAKQHVLKYLKEHQTDASLKALVREYLDQVTPGTTYYLTYEADNNTFGYATAATDDGVWTLEPVKTAPDALTPGVNYVQNNATKLFVNVKGKYDAEPELTEDQIEDSDALKANAAINVQFGRYSRNLGNFYRITELSNQGRDVVSYIQKGMEKAYGIVDKKLQGIDAYTKMASLVNGMLKSKSTDELPIDTITASQLQADVKTAFDLCAKHYAYMNLIDNGDGSVSLRVDVPKVPAALDVAIQMYTGKNNATFLAFAKDQIDQYFADPNLQTDANLKKLWKQNRDKWADGTNYYLSAESQYKTFEFTSDASDAATKWSLVEIANKADNSETAAATGDAPMSGTYYVKSPAGTYVSIKGKYYAKPDAASKDDASQVGIGIGYKDGPGYHVYSLTGTNPKDGSTIEVYDYVAKACNIVSQFTQAKIDKKLGTGDDKGPKQQALDDMADSICKIYTDDYAYMTLIPQAHYGNKWVVRAQATVPAIPYTVQAAGNYIVVGNEVIAGHKCTDVWDWAKQHVLKYLKEHQTDANLKALVRKYLDSIQPGTTYYLTYQADNNTFDYSTTPTASGLWTLEEIETTPDGLTPGVKNIKNRKTQYYVNVKGKYDAEPELTADEIKTDEYKANAAINVDFGRYDRSDANTYRITELSNQGRDVVAYIYKGMTKANGIVDKKLQGIDAYTKMASRVNGMLKSKSTDELPIDTITAAQLRADVKTAFDLCAKHYAYMKLIDNGNGSVSLRVDVPKVPAALDLAIQMYKGDDSATFIDFAKEQIDQYFADTNLQTDANLKKLWRQNRDKWEAGKTYYLSAEATYKTFEFTTDASDRATEWMLADVDATQYSETNPLEGYFRVRNVGGYGEQKYVEVRGRATADVTATDATKHTKPGTILYINLKPESTAISSPYVEGKTVPAYELLNVRSQGLDVMGGTEDSIAGLKKTFGELALDLSTLRSAYNGYVGFARYLLSAGALIADGHIRQYAVDHDGDQDTFDKLMADFNANYLPELKFQVYLIPVTGKTNTYLVRSMVPSMKPISDFYNANKTGVDNVVIPATRAFFNYHSVLLSRVGFKGEKFTETDDETINSWYNSDGGERHLKLLCEKNADGSLKGSGTDADPWTLSYSTILSDDQIIFDWLKLQFVNACKAMGVGSSLSAYINMLHYNTPYYLIEGDNQDAKGDRVYSGNASFGFANDGLRGNSLLGGSLYNDLANAGDHAQWTLEPVDETGANYFAVEPVARPRTDAYPNPNDTREGIQDRRYYAATYLDFPFKAVGDNVVKVYTIGSTAVQSGTVTIDAYGNIHMAKGRNNAARTKEIRYVDLNTIDKGQVVPAATPCIVEYNVNSATDSTLALVPVLTDARNTVSATDLVQGTFLGGKHNVDNSSDSGLLSSVKNQNIDDKWGTGAQGKDLYFFACDTEDTYSYYQFKFTSPAGDDASSATNNVPANKPFVVLGTDEQTPVYFKSGDVIVTSVDDLNVDTELDPNAPRYNVAGQRVGSDYKGLVISKGRKYIQR